MTALVAVKQVGGTGALDRGIALGNDQNPLIFPGDSGIDGGNGLGAPDGEGHQMIGEEDGVLDGEYGKGLVGHMIYLSA